MAHYYHLGARLNRRDSQTRNSTFIKFKRSAGRVRPRSTKIIPPSNNPDSYQFRFSRCSLCSSISSTQKKSGRKAALQNGELKTVYLPAAAPAAIGFVPAIFIVSIRAKTFSTLAPVSVHAST